MRSSSTLLAFTSSALLVFCARAQAQTELTRAYVVSRALASSPALDAAEARVVAAEARVGSTAALPDPMVSARIWGLPTRFDGPPSQTMLMAEQTFPLARVRRAGARVEEAGVEVTAAQRETAKHVVALEAERMLVEVCEADAMKRALADTRALYGRLRDVAAARTLVMAEDAVDVALLDVELARVEAELAESVLVASSRRAELATMLAVEVATLGACGTFVEAAPSDVETLVTRALEVRPELTEVVATRRRAEAMVANVGAMSAPMLTVGAGVMLMPEEEHVNTDRVQWMIEVGSTIPSFGRARRSRRAEAQAMVDEADAMNLELARMITRDVTRLFAEREARRVRATALRGPVTEQLDRALSSSISRYRIDGDVSSVLEVVRMSREIATERIEAEFGVVRADVELMHATGLGLSEDDR